LTLISAASTNNQQYYACILILTCFEEKIDLESGSIYLSLFIIIIITYEVVRLIERAYENNS